MLGWVRMRCARNAPRVANRRPPLWGIVSRGIVVVCLLSGALRAKERYFCFYATSFDPLSSGVPSRDGRFEVFQRKLSALCGFERRDFFYHPSQAVREKSIELSLQVLLPQTMASADTNHLLVVIEGLNVDDSLRIANNSSAISLRQLAARLVSLPLTTVTYLLDFAASGPEVTPSLILDAFLGGTTVASRACAVFLRYQGDPGEYPQSLVDIVTDGIDGGADSNFDFFLRFSELAEFISSTARALGWNASRLAFAATNENIGLRTRPFRIRPFHLSTLSGGSYHFEASQVTGPRVILFGALWCPACHQEMDDLKLLKQRTRHLQVIYVSRDFPGQLGRVKQQAERYPFLFLYEPPLEEGLFAELKWRDTLPLTVVLDGQGRCLVRKHGYVQAVDRRLITDCLTALMR